MRTISPSIENRLAEHHRGMPAWIRAPKSGHEYSTGLSCAKLDELAGRGVIRSFSLRDPGSIKGARFFHLQSVLDYLERAEKKEAKYAGVSADLEATPPTPAPLSLKGQTVCLANILTGTVTNA
ncbi:MAG TPA: hypothetical protein PLT00_12030 [Verrucomicrobiota bacterium]|jgi:hypothetical protein|nr:hypothetical protein [Verrucomicrobiota bacterium]OQB94716.1 MAG: hypothetical protein BWX84_00133 [Verrucomicrobia bacterium ADurb.Bin118]HPY31431.1 hypothetical protein [Verrucomicrobiota bacterium]HQB17430.1 hypothetical protein [Verrucomicrobiota bacterium]